MTTKSKGKEPGRRPRQKLNAKVKQKADAKGKDAKESQSEKKKAGIAPGLFDVGSCGFWLGVD
jgi:hypothetical protein